MNLRVDFIKNLSKIIIESEQNSDKKPQTQPIHKSKFKSINYSYEIQNLKKKSFYDLLTCEIGFEKFLNWIAEKSSTKILTKTENNELENAMNPEKNIEKIEKLELDEYQFMNLFKDIFNEVYEYKIYDLFELYEFKPNGKLGIKEVFLIVVFAAALENNQVLDFVQLFGDMVFHIISCGGELIYGIRLHQFIKLIGFPERIISKYMNELGMVDSGQYNFEDFELFMFALFEEKEYIKNEGSSPKLDSTEKLKFKGNLIEKKKDPGKTKTCAGICNIF